MAFIAQTPQRPLPGAYIQTPALNRFQSGQIPQSNFRPNTAPSIQQHGAQAHTQTQVLVPETQQVTVDRGTTPVDRLKPIDRAAKTINEILAQETQYPELDSYIGRKPLSLSLLIGIS